MKRKRTGTALFCRALAWIVLAFFALFLMGFVCHIGCCHLHEAIGDVCPICESFIHYTRLLRLTGAVGLSALLLGGLNVTASGSLYIHPESAVRDTLVSLRVKQSD